MDERDKITEHPNWPDPQSYYESHTRFGCDVLVCNKCVHDPLSGKLYPSSLRVLNVATADATTHRALLIVSFLSMSIDVLFRSMAILG